MDLADAQLTNVSFGSGAFRARLTGEPYLTYAIEKSPDFSTWSPVVTNNTASDGFFDFTNATTAGTTNRFYRSKWVP